MYSPRGYWRTFSSDFLVVTIVIMATVCVDGKKLDDLLEADSFKKSLKDAEEVVKYINKHFISLNDQDYTIYADHLKTVLTKLVQLMKQNNALFNSLYQKEHFAGSYADGLKIEKPSEYDMNLIIKLPVDQTKLQFEEATPSFIKIKGKEAFKDGATISSDLMKWVDEEGYLLQTKFREWMESVVTKALITLPLDKDSTSGNTRCLKVGKLDGEDKEYKVGHKKSGPAITLKVTTPEGYSLDVDLVPAFQFGPPFWPDAIEPLPKSHNKKNWMVIPKPKKLKEGEKVEQNDAREWRMSFLDQEREILSGTGPVKPTIKLLKKLRDTNNIKTLSSYAIKTVVMLEMKQVRSDFWKNRLTYIFLYMLHRLVIRIKEGHIPFYWDFRDDLLKHEKEQAKNVGNRLENILKVIVKKIDTDPCIVAEKLLTKEDFENVKKHCLVDKAPVETEKVTANQLHKPLNGDDALAKIYAKLEEMHQGQENSSKKVLEVLSKKFPGTENVCLEESEHEQSSRKQAELEERISNLEDIVHLLRQEVQILKEEKSSLISAVNMCDCKEVRP